MDALTALRQEQYQTLRKAFGDQPFTQEQVMAVLVLKQDEAAKCLADLERVGYAREEPDEIDRRIHLYRFVPGRALAAAEELNRKLGAWRKQASDEPLALAEAINNLWAIVQRSTLAEEVDLTALPDRPGSLTLDCAAGKAKQTDLRFAKAVDFSRLESKQAGYANEVLKLFDASGNAYRSATNVLLYFKKLEAEMAAGEYTLALADYATLDGTLLEPIKSIPNRALCPICRRFKQTHNALALISGNPKMDSAFQIYRGSDESKRGSMKICAYCFLSGYVDLPTALITKAGQGVNKGREYLFITTPLSRAKLERLLDLISSPPSPPEGLAVQSPRSDEETTDEETTESDEAEAPMLDEPAPDDNATKPDERDTDDSPMAEINQFLRDIGVEEGYEKLAVLGMSRRRLRELRGFPLPGASPLFRSFAVRVPVERLVDKQDTKVSGAVRRELIKATMYDFWKITRGSMYYNRITDAPFSVEGQAIQWDELRRANVAYRIANLRYARVGKYLQLNSGLFMLFLSQPRLASNRVLHRAGRLDSPPKLEQIKEIIDMTESISTPDWKFSLGLKVVELIVVLDLTKKARGFWYRDEKTGKFKTYKGYELSKWIQRIKMMRDSSSARAWGTSLINGYRREHNDDGPRAELVEQVIAVVEEIINTCQREKVPLGEFSREIANMDYYLLFYYNQRQANPQTEEGEQK